MQLKGTGLEGEIAGHTTHLSPAVAWAHRVTVMATTAPARFSLELESNIIKFRMVLKQSEV